MSARASVRDVLEYAYGVMGLSLPSSLTAAEDAVQLQMTTLGVQDAATYLKLLRTQHRVLEALADALTIGETYFFRTVHHFDFVRDELVPDWRREGGHRIRIWSAGCASGEEAWSLAALMHSEGLAARVDILATDVSRAALARAETGLYGEWSFRGEGAARMRPYVMPVGKRYRLNDVLRPMVRFFPVNLVDEAELAAHPELGDLDLIFCRNVLIYFRPERIAQAAKVFWNALRPCGVFVPGPSDPPLDTLAPFSVRVQPWGIALQRPEAGVAPVLVDWMGTVPTRTLTPAAVPAVSPEEAAPPPRPASRTPPPPPRPSSSAADQAASAAADEPSEAAREALAQGRWRDAADLASQSLRDAQAVLLRVRAIANVDLAEAEALCREGLRHHVLSTELHHLHALLLLSLGKLEDALRELAEASYLSPEEPAIYLLEAHVRERQGEQARAAKAYRNAEKRLRRLPLDTPLKLMDGERAGVMLEHVHARLEAMEGKVR